MSLTRRQFVAGVLAVIATSHRPNHPGKPTPTPTPTPTPMPAGGRLNAIPGRMQPGAIWVGGVA